MKEAINLDGFFRDYEEAANSFVEAKNLYRNEKAAFLLKLLEEADKKPSDSVLNAKIDSNHKLQLLRMDRDKKEIMAFSCKMALEAVIRDNAQPEDENGQ